jgi:hypothetical protein
MFCQMFAAKVFGLNFLLLCPPRSRRLHLTWRRLGAAAADTKRSAGYFLSCSHETFCGVTAAVAPNRLLAAGILFA